jgi:hypothetical protein
MDDLALLDRFLNHPPLEEIPCFPLECRETQQRKFADANLNALRQEKPCQFLVIDMGNNVHLICYQPLPTEAWRTRSHELVSCHLEPCWNDATA